MKYVAFLTALIISALLVGEIRTQRHLACFGCNDVKCMVREIDEHPWQAAEHPSEIIDELRQTSSWTDW